MDKHILVVEDDHLVRQLLLRLVRHAGFSGTGAATGGEALDVLDTRSFDLITLDMRLPDMTGTVFLDRLSQKEVITPVVVVSATPYDFDLTSQVKAVVRKPFSMQELIGALYACLP